MGQQQILLLVAAAIVVAIAITIGIDLFAAHSESANRDYIVSDLKNLGTLAIQFYRKPESYGGGNSSFISWKIPEDLDSTANGIYSVRCTKQKATITGFGHREVSHDGTKLIEIVAVVTSNNIVIKEVH